MNQTLILFPMLAMFALTMACIFTLGAARYRAIHKGEVRLSFFRTYDEGTQPQRLHLLGRHVQNHFEIPPLFHLGALLVYVTGSTTVASLTAAWLFVGARLVHSFIHLGSNNVSHRFFVFGFSLLCLCGLWISLFASLVI